VLQTGSLLPVRVTHMALLWPYTTVVASMMEIKAPPALIASRHGVTKGCNTIKRPKTVVGGTEAFQSSGEASVPQVRVVCIWAVRWRIAACMRHTCVCVKLKSHMLCVVCGTVLVLCAALWLLQICYNLAVTHAWLQCLPIASAPATAHCWVCDHTSTTSTSIRAVVGAGVAVWLA
jgi:hypothetical protein